ncbi:hypothetical protein [Roseovarius sp. 2305UL8-3]
MTTPDSQTLNDVQTMLKAARPDQIERLLRDILTATPSDNTKYTRAT